MIGYIASGVESPALFKSLIPMDSKLRSVSRGQLVEMATTIDLLNGRRELVAALADLGN
jgi:hypothetical protein